MLERRKIERKYLAVYSRVFDRATGQVLGYLADLSRKGAMIISDDPLPQDALYKLRFDLPDPPMFSANHLDMRSRVAWFSPDVDPSFYNVGFEFLSVSDQEVTILDEMIEAYEFTREVAEYPLALSFM